MPSRCVAQRLRTTSSASFHSRRTCSSSVFNGVQNSTARWTPLSPVDNYNDVRRRFTGGPSQPIKAQVPLRLMPLGGSVTYGQGSSDGNGYRNALRNLLISDGHAVNMVGSRKAGSMDNNDNEGWRGNRIDQIMQRAKRSIPLLLPNIYTINAGSNDCIQNFEINAAGKRLGGLLEYIWGVTPHSTIILSTLLVSLDRETESRILEVNRQIRGSVEQKIAEKKRIVLAEMHDRDGPQVHELIDGTHPHDAGYEKMAIIWHRSIQEAILKGFLLPS